MVKFSSFTRLNSSNITMMLFIYASTVTNNLCGLQKAGHNHSVNLTGVRRLTGVLGDLHELLFCFTIS